MEIYKRPLVDQHFRVLLIIDIQVKLEFVVSANVNISIGMTYWYKNAKSMSSVYGSKSGRRPMIR